LDKNLIDVFPDAAFQQVKEAMIQMSDLVLEGLKTSQLYLNDQDSENKDVVLQLEDIVNRADTNITSYLLRLAKTGFRQEDDAIAYTQALNIVKNYERMSDLNVNLVKFYELVYEEEESFTPEGLEDLNTMSNLMLDIATRSQKILIEENENDYRRLLKDEEYLDIIEIKYRDRHFERLADGLDVTKVASSVYVDILGTMERIGDHSVSAARNVFNVIKQH
ncbi:MAG TPA: PhoU domain-containing protein, partial [Erysipelothrix sp.]|nr:PhoU domain-containing protein [Erysipelothrix sp.]